MLEQLFASAGEALVYTMLLWLALLSVDAGLRRLNRSLGIRGRWLIFVVTWGSITWMGFLFGRALMTIVVLVATIGLVLGVLFWLVTLLFTRARRVGHH